MKVRVIVKLKPGVLDPQGQTILRSLNKMGHNGLLDVRQGKYFELDFKMEDAEEVRRLTDKICEEILSNPLIETYEIEEYS